MLPPWKVYPRMDAASLGWIMGPGEYYLIAFKGWFGGMPASQRQAFEHENAEPRGWAGFYGKLARQ